MAVASAVLFEVGVGALELVVVRILLRNRQNHRLGRLPRSHQNRRQSHLHFRLARFRLRLAQAPQLAPVLVWGVLGSWVSSIHHRHYLLIRLLPCFLDLARP